MGCVCGGGGGGGGGGGERASDTAHIYCFVFCPAILCCGAPPFLAYLISSTLSPSSTSLIFLFTVTVKEKSVS